MFNNLLCCGLYVFVNNRFKSQKLAWKCCFSLVVLISLPSAPLSLSVVILLPHPWWPLFKPNQSDHSVLRVLAQYIQNRYVIKMDLYCTIHLQFIIFPFSFLFSLCYFPSHSSQSHKYQWEWETKPWVYTWRLFVEMCNKHTGHIHLLFKGQVALTVASWALEPCLLPDLSLTFSLSSSSVRKEMTHKTALRKGKQRELNYSRVHGG